MTPTQASILSNCRVESNRIEKSIRQRELNGIESNFFHPNRNALTHNGKLMHYMSAFRQRETFLHCCRQITTGGMQHTTHN